MEFTIHRASDWFYNDNDEKKTFENLCQLKAFQLNCGHKLVIDFTEMSIVIYDDYLE